MSSKTSKFTTIILQLDEILLQASFLDELIPRVATRCPEILQLAFQSSSYMNSTLLSSSLSTSLSDLLTKGLFTKNFNDIQVLLLLPSLCPEYIYDTVLYSLLNTLGVARVRSISKPLACLLSTARSTALVIDSSTFDCRVTSIVLGQELLQPFIYCPFQGPPLGINAIYVCAGMIILSSLVQKIKNMSLNTPLLKQYQPEQSKKLEGYGDTVIGLISEFKTEFYSGMTIIPSTPIDTSEQYYQNQNSKEWWPLESLSRSSAFAQSSKQAACEYALSMWIDSVIKNHCVVNMLGNKERDDECIEISVPLNLSKFVGYPLPETISIQKSLWKCAFLIPMDTSIIHEALEQVQPILKPLQALTTMPTIIHSLFIRSAYACEILGSKVSSTLQSVTLDALLRAPIDERKSLSASIVLSGWIFSIPGFSLRFFQSLSYLIDSSFDIRASLEQHAETGPNQGFINGLAISRAQNNVLYNTIKQQQQQQQQLSGYYKLRPLLPLICSSNLTLPSHTAFAGASVFARTLLSTQRLVPDSTDIVSSTTTSKLSSSDKLRISDAFIESSITKSMLSRQKNVLGQITSQNSIMPQDSQIILLEPQPRRQQVSTSSHVEPPVLVTKASATSNLLISSNPVDARSKLTSLSLKLQKAKK
jgi:hypothetical protein